MIDDSTRKRDFTRPVIAAVDDDFRVRESIGSLLESAGYDAVLFESGDQFLNSGALAGINCLITDVRMPGVDGLELQRRIRMENPLLPVIFISAHVSAEVRESAFAGGAIEFLYKPFDAEELLRLVQENLGQSR